MCHLVLLLPLIGLPVFWLWPLSVALPVYLVILLLSAWVYYYAIVAMRKKVTVGPETLPHSRGEVVGADAGGFCVRVQSELWSASSREALKPGDAIEVVDVDGLTLRVTKVGQAGSGILAHGSGRRGSP
ncbi:MAG: NfeD family protein [Pseudomonadota bacterium]|nr:NfeD family protein [Pseudomonadota bacterium]